jgi:hypothetical protein
MKQLFILVVLIFISQLIKAQDTIYFSNVEYNLKPIDCYGARYYQNKKGLSLKKILKSTTALTVCKNIPELEKLSRDIRKCHRRQGTLAISGGACVVSAGVLTLAVFAAALEPRKGFIYKNTETFGRSIAGLLFLGVQFEVTSLMYGGVKSHKLSKAVAIYNKNVL